MTAFNAVRFRVKPGREQDFLNAHRAVDWPGLRHASIIDTGAGGGAFIMLEERPRRARPRPP